jgi:serine/threonine protein kinase
MAEDTTFGKAPGRLRRLLLLGRDEVNDEEPVGSWDLLTEKPGSHIGSYRLLGILGEGGMGIVYLAEQERPVKRSVALKIIKPGMDSARVIARFEAERQALALLDHPNIARVFEAGATDSGRPYFVMEYIEGSPITAYCDEHELTIDERLILFQQVCHAVQHAHQKGIIHRDIKPSNILVAGDGDKVLPKIIDFGVAKAVSQPLTERTLFTEDSQLLGTPEYMSPEQADMANEDIDTRSDVYSLGVLLYVLLTGAMPFDPETLHAGGVDHIRKVLRESDPKTPSTRLAKLGDEAKVVAANRRTHVATLAKRLHKELEWIPLMAMRKEREERYQSASELAEDIGRYLKGAALIAGPPSTVYRLKKSLRRNRALVTGVSVVMTVLSASVVVSTLFAIRAERQARISRAVSDFLRNDLLGSVDPFKGAQRGVSIESILDVASGQLDGKFEREPLVEASIRFTLGLTYKNLGKHGPAESNLKRAIALRERCMGTRDIETLLYMRELGWVYWYQGRYDEAERVLTETVNGMRRIVGEADPRLLEAISRLGWTYCNQGRFEDAEELQAQAWESVRRKLGPEHPYAPNHMEGLAAAYAAQGRVEEAEELCRKALGISRRQQDEDHTETTNIAFYLGQLCQRLGRYDEAEELYVEVLQTWRRRYGDEHGNTLKAMLTLGRLYRRLSRFDEARQYVVPVMTTSRRIFGEDNLITLYSMIEAAELHRDQGQYDEAEALLLKAEATARLAFGDDHKTTSTCVEALIELYESWSKPAEAARWRAKLTGSDVEEE